MKKRTLRQLRRLTEEEKSQLWERVASVPLPNPLLRVDDLVGWSHAITSRASVPKRLLDVMFPHERIERLVSAFGCAERGVSAR